MWVLLGVSNDTVEQETFVYFIGVFDTLLLAKEELKYLMETTTKSKKSDYIIKQIEVNKSYDYEWSNNEEDEIKNY
jgi:hypothetical protein